MLTDMFSPHGLSRGGSRYSGTPSTEAGTPILATEKRGGLRYLGTPSTARGMPPLPIKAMVGVLRSWDSP